MSSTQQTADTDTGPTGAAEAAKTEASHVAGTAKDEAARVGQEAQEQARNVLHEAMRQADDQSRVQRDKLVETVKTFSEDLRQMASGTTNPGLATDVAQQVADRARALTDRIEGREPAELLEELRFYARQHPATFLLGSLAAGVVAGRLVRAAKAAPATSQPAARSTTQSGSKSTAATPAASTGAPVPAGTPSTHGQATTPRNPGTPSGSSQS